MKQRLRPYLVAVLSVGGATALRGSIDPLVGDEHPLLLYYGALSVAAWYGGFWPALFSLALSYLAADWFFLAPRKDLSVLTLEPAHLLGFGTFVSTGVVIAAFSEAARRAKFRAELSADLAQKRGLSLEQEIFERGRAELELRQSQERLGLALEAARMVAWKWDRNADRTDFSPNAAEVTGLSQPFRIQESRPTSNSVLAEDLPRHTELVANAILEAGNYVSQFRFYRPDSGAMIWLEDHAKATCAPTGEVTGSSGIVMDITERKLAEQELERLNRELERRVKDRTEELEAFCYSVSHDLRAPLRTIVGFGDLLMADCAEENEKHKKLLHAIIQAATRMDQLITDLLALSRLSRCKVERRLFNLSSPLKMRPKSSAYPCGRPTAGGVTAGRGSIRNLNGSAASNCRVTYRLQRATSLIGPWTDLATNTAPASGFIEYQEANSTPGQVFYRTVRP